MTDKIIEVEVVVVDDLSDVPDGIKNATARGLLCCAPGAEEDPIVEAFKARVSRARDVAWRKANELLHGDGVKVEE